MKTPAGRGEKAIDEAVFIVKRISRCESNDAPSNRIVTNLKKVINKIIKSQAFFLL